MQVFIDVYKMTEIPAKTRIRMILKLVNALNYQYGTNFCEPLAYEFVKLLDPMHESLTNGFFGKDPENSY